MADIVHLRVHSDYSMSEGASKVKDLVARARELGVPAFALTDKNGLYGAWTVSEYAFKDGVQPIIGAHLYMEAEGVRRGNFLLLAQDEQGYQNLCAVLRAAYDPRPGPDGTAAAPAHPDVPPDALAAHAGGLIMLTGGGPDGLLPQLAAQDPEAAREAFQWLLSVFCDRLYVEVCRNGAGGEAGSAAEETVIGLAYGSAGPVECADGVVRSEAPLAATTDVWYAKPDRHDSWLLLKAVTEKRVLTMDGGAIVDAGPVRYHMRSAAEMQALFHDLPEALENTASIARRCAVMARPRKPILPPFACEGGRSEAGEIRHQAQDGLAGRLAKKGIAGDAAAPYWDRLGFELGVIEKMGFPGYFLIVSDFIKWAKANGIPVGPGRGSGAGSVVAWALLITDLDPLEFGLLFERFLNPERVSMPDFDVDFCETRRGEVIQYVQRKYGSDLVSMIATFGLIKAKTAIKDAARVVFDEQHGQLGYGDTNDICKLIPDNPAQPRTLSEAYEEAEEFRKRVDGSPKLRMVFDCARGIEGLTRQVSTHAAGVIIGDRPLHQLFPVTWDPVSGMPVCSFNMKGAEPSGAVKFDFLGLKTLTIIQLAVSYIKEFRGDDLDISAIPRDDADVYRRLAEGNTTGVFQLEGGGMRKALRQIKPTCLEDIIAVNALYRPGPMAYIPLYAQRKNGEIETEYPQPAERTRPFLEETYGIMVYQEQVMQVAQACAGYSLGGADLLRRAMGKKIAEEMAKQRRVFVHGDPAAKPPVPGAVKLGMEPKVAEALFDDIAKFADYGFNKSHAAAYAWIAYQTAWLKVHYPVEFFAATMSFNTADPESLALFKEELDDLKIPLLPPDVGNSHAQFRPEPCAAGHDGFAVRFGLSAIKQISGTQDGFLAERAANGPFTSLEDFHRRAGGSFNKAQMERLAEAGAFSGLSRSRRQAATVLGWLASHKDKTPAGQTDLFGGSAAIQVPQNILEVDEWGDVTDREFKAVGFYFSHHPIDPYVSRLKLANVKRRQSYAAYMIGRNEASLEDRKVCVMIDDIKMVQSQRGNTYLKAFVSEKGDKYQISCFERRGQFTIAEFRRVLEEAQATRSPVVFVVSLSLDRTGEGVWVNGRQAWPINDYLADVRGDLVIRMDAARVRVTHADDQNAMASAGSEADRRRVRSAILARRIEDLVGVIDAKARLPDGAPGGSPVRIVTEAGTRLLTARYHFPTSVEAILKTFDGVVSVREEFDPPEAEPRQSAAACASG